MWTEKTPRQVFERDHARERLVIEARQLARNDDAEMLGAHLASTRAAQRVMRLVGLAAVAALVALAALASEVWR